MLPFFVVKSMNALVLRRPGLGLLFSTKLWTDVKLNEAGKRTSAKLGKECCKAVVVKASHTFQIEPLQHGAVRERTAQAAPFRCRPCKSHEVHLLASS